MTKFILSTRPFKTEHLDKIKEIAPQYQLITKVRSAEDWQNVKITIGWQNEWTQLLSNQTSLRWVQSISAGVDLSLIHI